MSAASDLFPDGLCAAPCYGRLQTTNISGAELLVCEACGELTPKWDVEDVFGDEFYITRHEPAQQVPHYNTPEARKRDAIAASKYRDRSEWDPLDDKSDIQPYTRTTKY